MPCSVVPRLALLLLLLLHEARCGVRPADRGALWELYELTSGAAWSFNENWSPETDPCHLNSRWVGVGCVDPCDRFRDGEDCAFGRVSSLVLDYNGLSGNITGWHALGNLTNLTILDLSLNSIEGQLPREVGQLEQLTSLNLMRNKLGGTLPTELGSINARHRLEDLREMSFAFNSISGSIPGSIGAHSALASLNLRSNALVGELPTEMGALTQLVTLYLQNNPDLAGTLPQNLGGLTELRYLDLTGDSVSGTIPPSIGAASLLHAVHLEKNALSGTLPAELCSLRVLRTLKLESNRFDGLIPDGIGNLSSVVVLDLFNNSFVGDVPQSIRELHALEELYLDKQHLLPLRKHYCGQRLPDPGKYNWRTVRENYDKMMESYCPDDKIYSTEYTFSTLQDSGVYEQ